MAHRHHHSSTANIRKAFFINLGFAIFEWIGGWWVNSVAIMSDAIHDLGDSLSLGMAWYMESRSGKAADAYFSYGYRRFSLLAALINCIVLLVGSIYIISESVPRLSDPQEPDTMGMLGIAIIGVLVNGYAAWKVSTGKSMNERVISWHLLEDVLGWLVILIGALIMQVAYIPWLDAVLSLAITAYILWNVFINLKETIYIFLQGVPREVDKLQLESAIQSIPEVINVHDLHFWSLDGEHHVFSCHVRLTHDDPLLRKKVQHQIHDLLEPWKVLYRTIQIETTGECH